MLHSGCPGGSGSGSVTSIAAPSRPLASSTTSASVSTTGPRAALTSSAPSFIRARKAASTMPVVAAVSGTMSTTTSAAGSSSGSSAIVCTPGRAERATSEMLTSNGSSRAAMASPIAPAPTISTCLPASSSVNRVAHTPAAC